MKIPASAPGPDERGTTLIECLVYIAVLMVVVGIALAGFNRCWDDNKHLRQNANDIARALHAGEQWRADVRAASGDLRVTAQDGTEMVVIPRPGGNVTYRYAHGELQRQVTPGSPVTVVLDRVQSSQMQMDPRQHVAAWRWELTLQPGIKAVRMMPLFTFETVAGHHPP